ncbi:hypothetical protein ACFFS2_18725 [Streptomyces aurantiacus]|nr:hypothetical protein [Streptomyces aurantiacus]
MLLAGACGTSNPTGDSRKEVEPPVPANPPAVDPSTLSLPLDAYRSTKAEQQTIHDGYSRLMVDCMKRYGFDYSPSRSTGYLEQRNTRRYGITDSTHAAQRGYHPASSVVEKRRSAAAKPAMSASAQSVASGKGQSKRNGRTVPVGGCNGEARRTLLQGLRQAPRLDLVDELALQSYDRSLRHSKVVAAISAWSACMAKSGYNYRTPSDANNDRVFNTDEPTAQETATAVADVACKKQTNLVGIWSTVDIAYQKRLIEQNAQALDLVKRALTTEVKNAAAGRGIRSE